MSEILMCLDCIKDTKLKKYFLSKDTISGVCAFCDTKHHIYLDIKHEKFLNIVRALIRYHYFEVQYNQHFRGEGLKKFFLSNNHIFNHEKFKNIESIDLLVSMIEKYSPDSDDISLYNNDGTEFPFMSRLQDERDAYLTGLEQELLEKNFFLLEEEFLAKLKGYEKYFESTLSSKDAYTIFFRARSGCEDKCKGKENLFRDPTVKYSQYQYAPYKESDIGAAPVSKLTHNRLNRIGTAYLYLASDIETALSEIRPEPGNKVSIGSFRPTKELKIADLDKAFIELASKNETLELYTFINHIDQLLSQIVTSDEKHKYIVTQFFSDAFRKLGFDGIYYSSSLTSGQNLLIYNPDNFEYIDYESAVYVIESVRYKYEKLPQTQGIGVVRNDKES